MARRSAASPLATFLDYILTASPADGKAALEASIAAFGARMRVVPVAQGGSKAPAPVAAPAATSGPTGVVKRRPGRKPKAASAPVVGPAAVKQAVQAADASAPVRRRGRPAIAGKGAVEVPAVVATELPAGTAPLPDQAVDE